MATEADRLKRQKPLIRKRKTGLTLTGLLMEGLGTQHSIGMRFFVGCLTSNRLDSRFVRHMSNRDSMVASRVSVIDTGISLTSSTANGESKIQAINWANIDNLVAYKRDCYGSDLMCLGIGGAGSALEVTEEKQGWDELLNRAPDFLPGWRSKTDWYQAVMLPAFKENRTVIFSRS